MYRFDITCRGLTSTSYANIIFSMFILIELIVNIFISYKINNAKFILLKN